MVQKCSLKSWKINSEMDIKWAELKKILNYLLIKQKNV